MSDETQAVLLNAVPLLVLGATYLAVTAALVPRLVRQRRDVEALDLAVALVFPATAVLGLVLAGVVLHERHPLGGSPWPAFGAVLVALVPALVVIARWEERSRMIGSSRAAREAEARVSLRDRELGAVAAISNALVRAQDEAAIARVVCDEVADLVGVGFAALALVDQGAGLAEGLVARSSGADLDWWAGREVDLREPSGIASAVFEGAPVQVYDTEGSALVSRRLAELVGAKSGAWIPMVAEERVIGVLVLASTDVHRAFTTEELDVLQAIASEAALALDRARSAGALGDALERERLVAEISRKVRSELDVDGLMAVAVEETGRALGVSRCLIRLGEEDGLALAAEWHASRLEPVGDVVLLPASNLAARERRTVTIDDVEAEPELQDESLGGREALLSLGTRAVVAAPIVVFDRLIGVFAVHHAEPRRWTPHEVALVESVAREAGLALHTARLLAENRSRLEKQAALLHAAQMLTSELELEVVLERLVAEVARLLEVDAADCYLLEPGRGILRCAAVHGFDESLVGFEFPADAGLAGRAISELRPARSGEYGALEQRVPSPAYEGFSGALVAPIASGDEVRGVLGVGVRDGGRRFSDDDADVLGTLAGLAALALRNAESFGERSRQARIQRGFFLIAEVLGEPLSLAQTIDAIAQAAAQALGGDTAAVLVPGPTGLALSGRHELPEALAEALAERPQPVALLDAGAARRVLASSQLRDDDRFDEEWRQEFAAAGIRSLLAIPVEAPRGGEAAIALVLFSEEHRFVDDDLDLARQVARAARGALERAELYEAERSSRTLAQQLAQTGTLLATELDPPAVLEEVAEQAAALLGADAASIRSLEGDELVVAAGVGDEGESALGVRTPSTAWPAGDVVHSRSPVAIGDVGRTGRTADGEPVLGEGFAAYLGVPLYGSENALHGVLAVYSLRPRTWREEEVEALTALAANASVALSNAELYQRVALERELSVTILANIADGIVAVDRDGRIVLWNAAAAQITGVPVEEAIGRTPSQVLQRELESDGAGTGPGGSRLVSITRGGEDIWLSLSEAVMRDPVGAVAGRIFAFRDISSERIVEQMKSDFVSTVSHELRTPLTSIYGFAETLLREDVDFREAERRTFLGYIASESERLTSIVDALLNVARLDTGDLTVQLQPTDVGAVVRESVTAAQSAAEGNGHSFVLDLDDGALTADADADKLRQILDQLIQNAVNFSPDGSAVTVAAHRRPESVEVSVVDEGVGIPQSEQQRIFTKFYRGDGGQRGPGGAGLGLFIAQGLVAAMGGRIWVESGEGRGSAFRFELPAPREGE